MTGIDDNTDVDDNSDIDDDNGNDDDDDDDDDDIDINDDNDDHDHDDDDDDDNDDDDDDDQLRKTPCQVTTTPSDIFSLVFQNFPFLEEFFCKRTNFLASDWTINLSSYTIEKF